ncbi:MAG: DUF1127 domain-containing protein [Rhodospirillaceae bacterium]|nr:DUF1127 domain-containing protein [Rhodospirillaceae bacterium]MBT6203617.1 DUF1127 domain-containing protein [Rhodospirillaceae bacterium]MBT6512298.1 DUF1127 domain-containing protein [Rhodospirillaceae bacterium]MBT7611982.1 DUF1127 domain-containing protein [Rhodospirillaceae bacterium]MBT7647785.1 DUF1127 domain-containing protein [Rhodospirillaceae bacterium]
MAVLHDFFELLDSSLPPRASESANPRTRLLASMVVWHRRAVTRRHLAEFDHDQLCDIGKSRGEAAREASKPFWQA